MKIAAIAITPPIAPPTIPPIGKGLEVGVGVVVEGERAAEERTVLVC